jgi:cytochrome c oxidase cbb3-type subunit 4
VSTGLSYNDLRHLADSWGLLMMVVLFSTFVGWTFRPGAKRRLNEAATMIFKDGADEKAD